MSVEFHCEHCGKGLRVPDDQSGRKGQCPACGGPVYIPAADDEGEIPIAPIDETEERRRRQAAAEDAAIQRRLISEQPNKRAQLERSMNEGRAVETLSQDEVRRLVVEYVEAMASGTLEKSESVARRLRNYREQTLNAIEQFDASTAASDTIRMLPRPVLMGFLRQLRAQL